MSLLSDYQQGVEALVGQWLGPYTAQLVRRRARAAGQGDVVRGKEFNDPVWRTIILHPLEVLILDSPLIQRLRWIRQLGVAEHVFDGASHTRLQHSIGAVHMVDQLIDAVNASAGAAPTASVPPQLRRLMRLTALCHDIGHGTMSHVSDNALQLVGDVHRMRLEFGDSLKLPDPPPQLSEIAAYYMLGSSAFSELLDAAVALSDEHVLPREPAKLMQKAVIGQPITDDIPQLHELISGPFDADKLDYMTRDAQMTGVPVVVDIPRLVLKVRGVPTTADALPPEIGKTVAASNRQYLMIGIASSAGRALDELMLGRALLFDKVYRHHKIRAIESMVASIFLVMSRLTPTSPALLPLRFSDEQLLDIDAGIFEELAGRPLNSDEAVDRDQAIGFAKRIRRRELLGRCFAFSQRMPLDPYADDEGQRLGLLEFQRKVQFGPSAGRAEFAKDVAAEIAAALRIAEPELLIDYPPGDLSHWIWLDPPASSRQANVFNRAFLVTEDDEFIKYGDDATESKGWTDAYLQARDVGFIFGPRELGPYVYLAAEKVVRDRYQIRIPPSMISYSKQRRSVLDRLRQDLFAGGFYAGSAPDLHPVPARLTKADSRTAIRRAVENLSGYMGPSLKPRHEGTVSASHIFDFVRQFQTDELCDAALRACAAIRVIGREEVVEAVRRFVESDASFRGAVICPLGEPKDSSSINTYFAGDVAKDLDLRLLPVEQALISTDAPILFVDDFIGSGDQAVGIIEQWLGLPVTVDLHEEREELSDPAKEAFRKRRLGFAYAAGDGRGIDKLHSRAWELQLNLTATAGIPDGALPAAFETVQYESQAQQNAFRARCSEIGRELLISQGVDAAKADERSLGYGGRAFLVTFPYNTPTQSLTCLWSEGTTSGYSWMPLLWRRKKL